MAGEQSTVPVLCSHCHFVNVPGAQQCQVCGSRLPEVPCLRCGFSNPPGYGFCGRCGVSLAQPVGGEWLKASIASAPARPARPSPSRSEISPVALIGFGAILALASAAYPWYFLGTTGGGDAGSQTVETLLQKGWHLFPGIPLALIIISTAASSLVAVIQRLSRIRPYASLVSGFVTLFSATWLWQGFSGASTSTSDSSVPPELGAALITIGAIILVVGGIWTLQAIGRDRGQKN